ncbi:hypothetical protein NQ317_002892 [Molorchus minor]|uniref:Uncharacterized protein n=1 Tax=Molorchus minor TaxID=1323400 RepID=A0ABQ9JUS9_9CUCU|nr:hypothetical protein NQ317_002892 [Molorchus minor]
MRVGSLFLIGVKKRVEVGDDRRRPQAGAARGAGGRVGSAVRGIDCDYSRNDPSPPDFSRIFPMPKTTVFDVFPYIFRLKESISTIPGMIRALPTFPGFSRFSPNSPER